MAKRGLAGDDEMEAGMPAMQGSAIRPKTARGEGGAPANHVSEQSEKRRGSGSEDAARRGSEGGRDADLQVPDAGDGREYMEDDSGMRVEHMDGAECAFLYDEIFVRRAYLKRGVELRERGDILDVGANIGLFSLFCNLNLPQPPQPPALHGPHRGAAAGDAAQAGKGEGEVAQDGKGEAGRSAGGVPAGRARNRVFAFEPVPAIYQVLERNLKDLPEMHPRPYGLAAVPSSSETFRFYADSPGESSRHLEESARQRAVMGQSEGGTLVTCKVDTLSAVMRREGIEEVQLLKIDVEGDELNVLMGIEKDLWPRIQQVVLEVADFDHRISRVQAILERHGFRCQVEAQRSEWDDGFLLLVPPTLRLHYLYAVRP